MSEVFEAVNALASGEKLDVQDADLVKVKTNFLSAMDDDFNTPLATAEMLGYVKTASKIVEKEDVNLAKQANSLVAMFSEILGFTFVSNAETVIVEEEKEDNSAVLLDLIGGIREKLRADKNYALSDYIRDELNKLDITISDKKV
jgi:cysteinyl-tRNA synthetase